MKWKPPITGSLNALLCACLLVTACSAPDEAGPTPHDDTAEASASETPSAEADEPEFSGLLAARCHMIDPHFTLLDPDTGESSEIAFDLSEITSGAPDSHPYGRSAQYPDALGLPSGTECEYAHRFLLPQHEELLVSFTEEVNGHEVSAFGLFSADGSLTTLSPEQEVSDFGDPTHYVRARLDRTGDRIVFVESPPDGARTIQELDLETGEIDVVAPCPDECANLELDPRSGTLYHFDSDTIFPIFMPNAGYWASFYPEDDSLRLDFFFDDSLDDDGALIDLDGKEVDRSVSIDTSSSANGWSLIGAGTLLFLNDRLEVARFDAEELTGTPQAPEPLEVSYPLVPGDSRTNETPVLSPDGNRLLFRSSASGGDEALYTVPLDGSEDPTRLDGVNVPAGRYPVWL